MCVRCAKEVNTFLDLRCQYVSSSKSLKYIDYQAKGKACDPISLLVSSQSFSDSQQVPNKFLGVRGLLHKLQTTTNEQGPSIKLKVAQQDYNKVLEKALAKIQHNALQAKQNLIAYIVDCFNKYIVCLKTTLVLLLFYIAAT